MSQQPELIHIQESETFQQDLGKTDPVQRVVAIDPLDHLGLVRSYVSGTRNFGITSGFYRRRLQILREHGVMDYQDLMQEGYIGLAAAAEEFDGERGFQFSTSAMWKIGSTVTRATERLFTIRMPSHVWSEGGAYGPNNEYTRAVVPNLNLPDTDSYADSDELARLEDHIPRDDMATTPQYDFADYSASEACDNVTSLIELKKLRIAVENILDERLAKIIFERFGFNGTPKTQEEIGSLLNLTRQRVQQLEAKALDKLRSHINPTNSADLNDAHLDVPITQKQDTTTKPSQRFKKNASPLEAVADMILPANELPELPRFSVYESRMGMTHQDWLNLALEHIYFIYYQARQTNQKFVMPRAYEKLNNRVILDVLSTECELIDKNLWRETSVKRGSVTTELARKVIDAHKARSNAINFAAREKEIHYSEETDRALAIGNFVINNGLFLTDPKTGIKIDPNYLSL